MRLNSAILDVAAQSRIIIYTYTWYTTLRTGRMIILNYYLIVVTTSYAAVAAMATTTRISWVYIYCVSQTVKPLTWTPNIYTRFVHNMQRVKLFYFFFCFVGGMVPNFEQCTPMFRWNANSNGIFRLFKFAKPKYAQNSPDGYIYMYFRPIIYVFSPNDHCARVIPIFGFVERLFAKLN